MTTLYKIKAEIQSRYWKNNQGKPIRQNAYNGALDDVLAIIDKYAEQEPKTGHWIRITNGAMKEKYICSECCRQIEDYGIEGLLHIKYPYCHCGAKMVEPQETETWHGIHAQITAPKGTFERIFNEADDDYDI